MTDSYVYDSLGDILLSAGSTVNWRRFVGRVGYLYENDLALCDPG